MKKVVLFVLLTAILTGCYWNSEVEANQVAVTLERNEIQDCKGPGVYTDGGWWADIQTINVDTLTFSVEDPEVMTKDTQPVGVKITIQARRQNDCEAVKNLFTNWNSLVDNENLAKTIAATAREGIKNGVIQFTLTELLKDRNGLANSIEVSLQEDAAKYSAEIVNVTIENIDVNDAYIQTLNDTAQFTAEINKKKQEQELIEQEAKTEVYKQQQEVLKLEAQLAAEKAITEIELERARRRGEVIAAANQVYMDNPAAYASGTHQSTGRSIQR